MVASNTLLATLREDQRARWRRGDSVPVENYLRTYPALASDADALLDLVCHEVTLRQELGQEPALAEYVSRFPQLRGQLQALFDVPRTRLLSAGLLSPEPSESTNNAGHDMPAVPGYEILSELGRGGMGVVYKARHVALKRVVALKMILAGRHADDSVRRRFRTEAEAVARLQHANIVQVFEVGEHEGRPFLALEYVEGTNLQELCGGLRQPETHAAQLVETLARALHYTHQRGIIHRDLKPANILLQSKDEGGRMKDEKDPFSSSFIVHPSSFTPSIVHPSSFVPKVTDFGLARLLDDDGARLTRTEALIGTPNYMPPEQAGGQAHKIGVPADVYSLGAILYELLTGRTPFQGNSILDTLEQVRSREPVPPRRFVGGAVSRDLETICLKCLEKDPSSRYASAEALADDLRRFLDGDGIQARPTPWWQRACRYARRRPARVAGAMALLAVLCLLVTSWSYVGVARQLGTHRIEQKLRTFRDHRNEAHLYGLLAADQGALFVGSGAAGNKKTAEAAAREALALAGVSVSARTVTLDRSIPEARRDEIARDCHALLLLLAELRERDGGTEALRILDLAPTLGVESKALHVRRAQVLERLERPQEAQQERDLAAAFPSESALDLFLLGEDQFRRGLWDEATMSFDRASAREPAHFWAQFFLAVCHLKGQRWETAKAGLNTCLAQHPDFVWAYLFRSVANEKLRAWPEAEQDFRKALELDPNADARYVLHLSRGILYFNRNDLAHAEEDFRAALALKPQQYNACMNLAQVHLARKDFAAAAQQLDAAMKLQPPVEVVVGYHLERGRNLLRDRKYTEAVEACDKASSLALALALPHAVRGQAFLALGRFDLAETAFDVYLRRGGEATADVFRGRGQARMKLGRFPEAAEDYTRAIEREPGAEIYQHRGWAHVFADAWKLALRDFDKAIALDLEPGDAHIGRGLARVMLGDYRAAVADADRVCHQTVTPEMMHNIACIFAQAQACAGKLEPRPSLADHYHARALQAVCRTLELVPARERLVFWQNKIIPDPALLPLQGGFAFEGLKRKMAAEP